METDNALAPAAASREKAPLHPPDGFTEFFRTHYRSLIRAAMYAGADEPEARLIAQDVMTEVLMRWADIINPLAYARRATVSLLRKARRDHLDKLRARQVQRGAGTPEACLDQRLSTWEDRQWVRQLLDPLPAKQREVMALIVDGFEPGEIACLLGRTPEAVRQNLREARNRLKHVLERDSTASHAAEDRRKES